MRCTTLRMDDDVRDALLAMARRRGVTLAENIRKALAAYVSRHRGRRTPLSSRRSPSDHDRPHSALRSSVRTEMPVNTWLNL